MRACFAGGCLLALLSSAALPQSSVVLIDSTGKVIGPMIDQARVVMTFNGQAAYVDVSRDGFVPDEITIYFKEDNCQGLEYASGTEMLPRATYSLATGNFTVPALEGEMFIPKSNMAAGHACDDADSPHAFIYTSVAATIPASAFGFRPPFSARVH